MDSQKYTPLWWTIGMTAEFTPVDHLRAGGQKPFSMVPHGSIYRLTSVPMVLGIATEITTRRCQYLLFSLLPLITSILASDEVRPWHISKPMLALKRSSRSNLIKHLILV
jgi:hypothetical protein